MLSVYIIIIILEWLRLQEEGDLNIWNCSKIPVHKPRETGLMSSLIAYINAGSFLLFCQAFALVSSPQKSPINLIS